MPKPMFSDAFRYPEGSTKDFTFSCYLIKHGDDYMVWDAGLPGTEAPRIVDQLAQLGLTPLNIRFLGVSHYHFDHIGQAADFGVSTLLIGAEDFAAVRQGARLPDNSTTSGLRLAPWIVGGGKVELLSQDHDVFGDGTVRVLRLPGHTPGHRALLVALPRRGNVLLSGDLYHFPENRHFREVPAFNTDRAQTQASMQRFEEIATRLNAQVIIQHEPGDVAKLPVFPNAAE
ncbi:N-acyl homoserine lactonase family protein [Novosphingobium umbonatum]|uniref:N-acyl homoserine lactonase family protein n=1 Tax=Novosphingobium umbonatum TaxID=1908524 RepID=UPI001FEC4F24|nr:N-acyl homoserine lactonase family protein [Novosphingobium umbonatum]